MANRSRAQPKHQHRHHHRVAQSVGKPGRIHWNLHVPPQQRRLRLQLHHRQSTRLHMEQQQLPDMELAFRSHRPTKPMVVSRAGRHTNAASVYVVNTNGFFGATNSLKSRQRILQRHLLDRRRHNGPARAFNGTIDEVAVFNHALTPTQLRQLYNSRRKLRSHHHSIFQRQPLAHLAQRRTPTSRDRDRSMVNNFKRHLAIFPATHPTRHFYRVKVQ